MTTIHPQFITDNAGNKISAVISIKEFEEIIEHLEELEDIKIYDANKSEKDSFVDIDDAFKMIETKRNGL